MSDTNDKRPKPIAGRQSTDIFRIANFELFVKPNKYVMGAGVCAISLCVGYLVYINLTSGSKLTDSQYIALNEDDTQTIQKKKSKWS